MKQHSHSRPGYAEDIKAVYVILRVFNLGKESMGVKVFVDPESMRLAGELDFEAETWRVEASVD